MEENLFFDILEKAENMSDEDLTQGYFPTINEIEAHVKKDNLKDYLPIIAYFANDPFSKQQMDGCTANEYKATVKYCKDFLSKVELD